MVQERPGWIERRLSAILAADVAGYSRLMHSDEETKHAPGRPRFHRLLFPSLGLVVGQETRSKCHIDRRHPDHRVDIFRIDR